MSKFHTPDALSKIVKEAQNQGKIIGLSHGVFDLVHPGHIQHFIAAKKDVDYLIVSITADKFVNKGPGRPLFDQMTRVSTLEALEAIDFVTISDDKTAEKLIRLLKPNLYFKGSDYKDPTDDPTGKINDERKIVEENGGEVRFTNELTSSSSKLINNFFSNHNELTKNWLNNFKRDHNLEEIDFYLTKLSELEVSLFGEVIIDQYTIVEALAKSSKDPILAFHITDTNIFAGGILAIANNCAGWVKKVSVFSLIGENDSRPVNLAELLNPNIELNLITSKNPTITKHRYIDSGTNSKVFETYEYNPSEISPVDLNKLVDLYESKSSSNIILVADYGHGLFSRDLIKFVSQKSSFLGVNTQANAGNRGYNTLSKYESMDFFTANSGELQLELRTKFINYDEHVPEMLSKFSASYSVLTLGAEGLIVFTDNKAEKIPSFATRVVDKIGAGDSVFAISSLLAYLGAPPAIIGLVSNLVAAHEVQQLGHQTSLSLGDIRKQLKAMLG